MRSKLLYIQHSSSMGGAERSLYLLLKHLDKFKFHPIVIVPDNGKLYRELSAINIDVRILKIHWIQRTLNPVRLFKYFVTTGSILFQIKNLIKRHKILLIHTNSIGTQIYGGIIGKLTNLKVIWHVRDIIEHNFLNNIILKLNSKLSTHIICISEAVQKHLIEIGIEKKKCTVIFNGVALNDFNCISDVSPFRNEFLIKNDEVLVGIIGRLMKLKGQVEFIRAAQKVVERNKKVKFVIVGDNHIDGAFPDRFLNELVYDLDLENYVFFTGFREDIPNIIQGLDLVVSAAILPEAFGRVIIEAMATSKPVIVTNIGGLPELVLHNETGLIVEPGNVDELAEAIHCLSINPDVRVRMGKAGKKRAEMNFSLIKNIEEIQANYTSLLNQIC